MSYWLKEDQSEKGVKLSFTDLNGRPINGFNSAPKDEEPAPDDEADREPRAPAREGMNRFVWKMRYGDGPKVPGDKLAEKGAKGPLVAPGTYQVHLRLGETKCSQSFELLPDPRVAACKEDYEQQVALLLRIQEKMTELNNAINRLRAVRAQVEEWAGRAAGNDVWAGVTLAANKTKERLEPIEDALINVKSVEGSDGIGTATRLNVKLAELTSVVSSADTAPTEQSYELFDDLSGRIEPQLKNLQAVIDTDVQALIDLVRELEIPAVVPKPTP